MLPDKQNDSDDHVTRDQARSRRPREVRAKTINLKRVSAREIGRGKLLYPESGYFKPTVLLDCAEGPRPCPYVSCKYHLYLDVTEEGAIKLNFPDLEVWEMVDSCALDVADRGGTSLHEVGAVMNLTRERVRQILDVVFRKLRKQTGPHALKDWQEVGTTKRRLPMYRDVEDDV